MSATEFTVTKPMTKHTTMVVSVKIARVCMWRFAIAVVLLKLASKALGCGVEIGGEDQA
jgi:hypothetical protein